MKDYKKRDMVRNLVLPWFTPEPSFQPDNPEELFFGPDA